MLRVSNGGTKNHFLRMLPFYSIDIRNNDGVTLNLITYTDAKRRINKHSEHAELIIIRDKEKLSKVPSVNIESPTFRPLVDEYYDIFKEELPPSFKRRQ